MPTLPDAPADARYEPDAYLQPPFDAALTPLNAALGDLDRLAREDRLNPHAVEHAERLFGAFLHAARLRALTALGYSLEDWRGEGLPPREGVDPDDAKEDPEGATWRAWMDHAYALTHPEYGRVLVGEPYTLDAEAILDLARLVQLGYDVRVTLRRALHFPGGTLRVSVHPPTNAQEPTA